MAEAEQFLALDVGKKRTGIARASGLARLAEPMTSVKTTELFDYLPTVVSQNNISAIIIGLPRNLNGDESEQTRWMRDFSREAKNKLGLPFFWQDEALTSQRAESLAQKAKNQDTDALAAAIILQDFLDTPEADRVPC